MPKWLCYIVLFAVKALHLTYRHRYFNVEHRKLAEKFNAKNVMIMATWHNNCFSGILSHTHQNFAPLMSQSKDGDLVAFVCEKMGIKTVRGSSSKGGTEARAAIVANFDRGLSSAITVDGPKGPMHEVKLGIVDIAKRAQVAILPFCAVADRYWELKSWDSFRIAKPFSKISIRYGEPIYIPADLPKSSYLMRADLIKEQLMLLESPIAPLPLANL